MNNEGAVFRNLLLLDIIVFGESSIVTVLNMWKTFLFRNITVSMNVSLSYK
jgi:hypothetical protein